MADIVPSTEKNTTTTAEQLLPLVYQELRKLAAAKLRQEKPGQTLQATALVHEAFLRLVENAVLWDSKGHFFASAAKAMRRILIENARRKTSSRNGGDWQRIEFIDFALSDEADHERLVELDDALSMLAELDAQAARVAELRIFAGLTLHETAETLEIAQTTTFREWNFARAWLKSQMRDQHGGVESPRPMSEV